MENIRTSFERGIKNVLQGAIFGTILGCVLDIFKYREINAYFIHLNLSTIIVFTLFLLLYYFRILNFKRAFTVLIYLAIINIYVGEFVSEVNLTDALRTSFFLRDTIFIILLMTMGAFGLHRVHVILIGGSYLVVGFVFSEITGNSFLIDNRFIMAVVISIYGGLVYYLVTVFERSITLFERRGTIISEQSDELQRTNTNLALLNQSKDMFLSIIAHDLKNPMHNIMLSSEYLKTEFDRLPGEKILQMIELMHSTSGKTCTLLENLLLWARSQSNKIQMKPVDFNMSELAEHELEIFTESLAAKKISVLRKGEPDCFVNADMDMIGTVMRNLISNAIKFTHPGGTICVKCEKREDGNIRFEVQDNGVGMSAASLAGLFNIEKVQIGQGTSGETGTGLGLIICREFIEKNRGSIWAESKENEGSSLIFTLPQAKIKS